MILKPLNQFTRTILIWCWLSLLNNNGSYDEAKDIFQEAMITLYEKAKSDSFVLTCQIKNLCIFCMQKTMVKTLAAIRQNNIRN